MTESGAGGTGRPWHRLANIQGPVLLVAGSAWDFATLRRVDRWTDHLLLVSYLALLAILLVFELRLERGVPLPAIVQRRARLVHLATQFLFGGLLSAYVVYYTKSATFGRSLVFLLVLVALLITNELAVRLFRKGAVRIPLAFLCAFCMLLVLLPVWSGRLLGFVPAGLGAMLFVFGILVAGRARVAPSLAACGALLVALVGALELGLIPPVPLALTEAGAYHAVRREEDGYHLVYEDQPWWTWNEHDKVFHWTPGQRVWCFSAVFAPIGMKLEVVHHWQQWSPENGWVDRNRIPFDVNGGRDGGFRGYTYKDQMSPGRWRVIVETPSGQEIGRVPFLVVEGSPVRAIVERVY